MMTFVLGLTGSFGSGKSTVSAMFAERGAEVIDADQLAREATEPGQAALAAIAAEFGPAMLDEAGRLKRKELAKVVFADRRALRRLNAIVHPVVRQEAERLLKEAENVRAEARTPNVIVLDVPLMFEAGFEGLADKVAVVAIDERQRFLRLRRRGFTEREIVQRLGMQMPQSSKIRRADAVIDNSGTIDATRKQVQTLMDQIIGETCKPVR